MTALLGLLGLLGLLCGRQSLCVLWLTGRCCAAEISAPALSQLSRGSAAAVDQAQHVHGMDLLPVMASKHLLLLALLVLLIIQPTEGLHAAGSTPKIYGNVTESHTGGHCAAAASNSLERLLARAQALRSKRIHRPPACSLLLTQPVPPSPLQ
jgi:hypothetical protein